MVPWLQSIAWCPRVGRRPTRFHECLVSAVPSMKVNMMTSSEVSQRAVSVAESATLAITSKAKDLRAAGEPVIGFGAGEPDFPTPAYIVDAARVALEDPSNFRYTCLLYTSPSPRD